MEDLRYIELSALLVYDDWYVKPKIRTYGDKGYTNFRGLKIDSLFAHENKYCLKVYLESYA